MRSEIYLGDEGSAILIYYRHPGIAAAILFSFKALKKLTAFRPGYGRKMRYSTMGAIALARIKASIF